MRNYIIQFFLPIFFVFTVLALGLYLLGQNLLRMSANDPQVALVYTTRENVQNGALVEEIIPNAVYDLSSTESPYLMVADTNGMTVKSMVVLDGKTPTIPKGVFDYATREGENRVTWQPKEGVRQAIVVLPYKDGYLVAGRSLREPEARIHQIGMHVFFGWLLGTIGLIVISFFPKKFLKTIS